MERALATCLHRTGAESFGPQGILSRGASRSSALSAGAVVLSRTCCWHRRMRSRRQTERATAARELLISVFGLSAAVALPLFLVIGPMQPDLLLHFASIVLLGLASMLGLPARSVASSRPSRYRQSSPSRYLSSLSAAVIQGRLDRYWRTASPSIMGSWSAFDVKLFGT